MEERQAWYQRFLEGRSSPFTRPIPPGTVSEGFVYEIGKVQLRELEEGKPYYVHCYFYDGERNHFFGRDNQSNIIMCNKKTLIFNEAFFFHAPITTAVHIVMEIVRSHNGYDDLSVAWSVLEMGAQVRSLPYYGQHHNATMLKQKLYSGSPKFLLISKTLTSFSGLEGAAETRLLAHPSLSAVSDFFPEYGLFHSHDDIPGVSREGLARGRGAARVMGYIDGVGLTLGGIGGAGESGKDTVESIVEQMMTQDWSYRANEIKPGQRMEVIERRLRVGVHNGLAYISSPLTVHLVPQEELMTGTQSLRRKARSSAKGQNPPSSSHSLVVRSRISLPIVKDSRFALVFSIDFLLGVRAADGTISHSQSVMIGWGIALPFSSDPTAFYLTGGPRANPDEVLCFKSLRELGRSSARLADDRVRDLALAFHFYLADEPPARIPEPIPDHHHDHREPQPEIRQPVIREPEPDPEPAIVEIEEEIIEEEEELVPVSRTEGGRRGQPVRSKPERPDRERDRHPPPDAVTSYREHLKVEDVYEPPMASIQPLARSSLAFLAASKFCAIRDRNGDAPTLVDPMDGRPIDVAIERNDRLATNEVVLQLLAMKWNTQDRPPSRVYFTFQFFRIPMITTEILSIDSRDSILRRMQPDAQGEYPAGFTAKLTIDRASLSSSEELAAFLASGEVCIEAWDADSMIPLGAATLPLRASFDALCRRGAEAVQFYAECSVIQSSLPIPPRTMGTLYVRAANIGHPFSNQMDLLRSHSSSFVAYSLPSIGHSSSTEREGMVVRAKPLSASHQSNLQRFIQSQRIDMHRRYAEILNERSLKSIGDWEELKKKVPGSAHHESSLKRFIFEGELEAYRKARGESKANKLLAAVFKGLTVSHSFCISLGEVHVFEFLLANPFPHAVNCAVLMEDTALSIVHSEEEWDSWKRGIKHPKEEQRVDSTIFKRALSKDSSNLLYLRPSESLLIPFKYDGLRVSAAAEEGAESEVKVIFKEINSGEPLSVLDLKVQKRPYALSRSFRFLADEMTNFEKHIRMRDKRRMQSIRCSDPSAKVALVQDRGAAQVVRITAYMGPSLSVRKLIVFLYEDAYCHRLAGTWKIEVHALTRVDVHSVQGQSTNVMLPLPSDLQPSSSLFRLHSTSPAVHLPHPQPLQLSSTRPLAVQHTSTTIGSAISLLSLTSASDAALVNIYAVHSHISAPHVSSSYQISIDSRMHEPVVKRLAVHNSYSIPRSFRLVSSHPDLMRPLNEVVSISPEGVVSPPLQFRPVDFARRTVEMHLFIQDAETGQEEETYSLRVVYEPM